MCLALPALVTAVTPGLIPTATATQLGREVTCRLAYVPAAKVGDYVLIQHGFAVEILDEQAAAESIAAFAELGIPVSSRT
jgi:hydrogenase expression/formation protein HypC